MFEMASTSRLLPALAIVSITILTTMMDSANADCYSCSTMNPADGGKCCSDVESASVCSGVGCSTIYLPGMTQLTGSTGFFVSQTASERRGAKSRIHCNAATLIRDDLVNYP